MDISVLLNDIKVNIRAAVIIESERGYIFEKDESGRFYVVVGGRIKANESSMDAAKREVKEELGIDIEKIHSKAIVESFFVLDNENFHEICFYYEYKLNRKIKLPENYYIFSKEEMKTVNIQPKVILEIIDSDKNNIQHIILNESTFYFA